MKTQDWRISVFDANGRWKGFDFADTEEEAREQAASVRLPGDWAVVSCWNASVKDYRQRFIVGDAGEECRICDGTGTDTDGVDCPQCQAQGVCPRCGAAIDYCEPTADDETYRRCDAACGWAMS